MICYPAVIEYDREDDTYNVGFPDLPGCLTFGDTIDDAKENAKEALSAYLESIDSRKLKVPAASELTGTNVFPIEPDTNVVCDLTLPPVPMTGEVKSIPGRRPPRPAPRTRLPERPLPTAHRE